MCKEGERRHGWIRALQPAVVGAAALGLTLGVIGAGTGLAGATPRYKGGVSNFAKYIGGHGKADKALSPVTIGAVNQQTSTAAPAPMWMTGAKVAEQYINAHAGGIDGHPVNLVTCVIPTTVGSASKCGEEFADNAKVTAVAAGAIDVGNTALESALAPSKKPTFFSVALSEVDEKDPDGFILFGDITHVESPMATFAAKDLHVKSVSITYPSNEPGEVIAYETIARALKYEGVKNIYSAGFTTSDTNLTEPFEAAHAGKTTLFLAINSGGPACSDTYLTLKSLGITEKVLANSPCDTPTIAKADGGTLPTGWYYAGAGVVPGEPHTSTVTAMTKVAKEYGKGPLADNAWFANGFAEVAMIAKLDTELAKAGKKLTSAALMAKAKAYKGAVIWGPTSIDCGMFSGFPAVCSDVDQFYENTAPGVMKLVGEWVGPPKGFKVSATTS